MAILSQTQSYNISSYNTIFGRFSGNDKLRIEPPIRMENINNHFQNKYLLLIIMVSRKYPVIEYMAGGYFLKYLFQRKHLPNASSVTGHCLSFLLTEKIKRLITSNHR